MLSQDFIKRLQERIATAEGRTDHVSTPVQLGNLSIVGSNLFELTGGSPAPAAPKVADLSDRATDAEIAAAEAALGFPIPGDLRQLYQLVANGGFGPGDGLLATHQLAVVHADLQTASRGGQKWPANLLPVKRWEVGCHCINVDTGEIVYWDEEELAEGASDKVWKRSFRPIGKSLAEWLDDWLQQPTIAEQMRQAMEPTAEAKARMDHIQTMSEEEFEALLRQMENPDE